MRKQSNVMLLLGAAALGALGYFLWKNAQPAAAQAGGGQVGGGGGGGGGWEPGGGPHILPIGQPAILPWPGWQVPQGIRDFIAPGVITLPGYGFTRIGLDQPVIPAFSLRGSGFTIL